MGADDDDVLFFCPINTSNTFCVFGDKKYSSLVFATRLDYLDESYDITCNEIPKIPTDPKVRCFFPARTVTSTFQFGGHNFTVENDRLTRGGMITLDIS